MKLNLTFSKFITKPILATVAMGICSYAIYLLLIGMNIGNLATIIAILVAILVYILAVIRLKILSKEEIFMIPYGQKLYKILEKFGIYKKNWKCSKIEGFKTAGTQKLTGIKVLR